MSKKQTDPTAQQTARRPVGPVWPSDADRLAQGQPLESGDAQPRPASRRTH